MGNGVGDNNIIKLMGSAEFCERPELRLIDAALM
jgi:hypothetical protein